MAKQNEPKRRGVVRREGGPRKRQELSPELERLARGEDDRLRPPPRRPRLRDDRAVALVPGVANRDARAVFDAYLARLEEARPGHPDDAEAGRALAEGLRTVLRTRLWRGRSLTGFGVMTEQLLDLPEAEARSLAGEVEPATEEATAVWFRAEAALLEAGLSASVRIVEDGGREHLELRAEVARAPHVLEAVAKRLGQLGRDMGR